LLTACAVQIHLDVNLSAEFRLIPPELLCPHQPLTRRATLRTHEGAQAQPGPVVALGRGGCDGC
jgi:hypothetical protein